MFEALILRVERRARARATARARELAALLAEAGVAAEADARGVVVSGKGLRRRLARDARLRALIAGAGR
jgi:hypothetical protein